MCVCVEMFVCWIRPIRASLSAQHWMKREGGRADPSRYFMERKAFDAACRIQGRRGRRSREERKSAVIFM